MNEYDNFLSLEVIWRDDDILEIEVTASHKGFSGVARGYDMPASLEILAARLEGFPKDDQPVIYEVEKNETGYFSITFCRILGGLVKVNVYLEDNNYSDFQNSKVYIELMVYPSSIDTFIKFLATMAANRQGKARLSAI